jgi:hypothetical protein
MQSKSRFILTLSPYLKRQLEQRAITDGCSQAEVIKAALTLYFNKR